MGVNLTQLTAQIAGLFLVFAAALFGPAGTVAWPAGWTYLLIFFGFTVAISVWLLRHNPALLTERMTGIGKADQKVWDKALYVVLSLLFVGWLVLMALDAVRFGWSTMPAAVQASGAVILLVSFRLFFLVFRENTFLSPAVRIQSDRGHTVVSTGPYRYVRHPMYAAAIIFMAGTSLLLGSWWGLLASVSLILVVAFRAVREERTLLEELPGYGEYMRRVRYRLVPHVW